MNNIDNTTYTTSNISNMLNDDKRKISAICKLNNEQLIAKFYSIYENIAEAYNSNERNYIVGTLLPPIIDEINKRNDIDKKETTQIMDLYYKYHL